MPEARVVIDSNVWISALVFGGAPRHVFETIIREGIRIAVSAEILTEIRRVIATKFPDFADDTETLIDVLQEHLDLISLGSITIQVSRDPDDDRVLETAILGEAAAIISGDHDLLSLAAFQNVTILRPSDWLERQDSASRPAD